VVARTGDSSLATLGSPWFSTILGLVSSVTTTVPSVLLPAATALAMMNVNYHSSPLSMYCPPSAWNSPFEAAVALTGLSIRGGDRAPDGCIKFHNKTSHKARDLYSFLRAHPLQYVTLIFPPAQAADHVLGQISKIAKFCEKSESIVTVVVTKMPELTEKFVTVTAKNFFVGVGQDLVRQFGENHVVVVRPDAYLLFLGDFMTSLPKMEEHLGSLLVDL